MKPKLTLGTVAALALALGVGGTIGHVATGIASYGVLADSLAGAQVACQTEDRAACRSAVDLSAAAFQQLDSSAKSAYQDALKRRAGSAGGTR
jgi:hypothetical protein